MTNRIYWLAAIFFLTACGGGGGGGSSSDPKVEASVVATTGGSVSPMAIAVSTGGSASFTIIPAEGYNLKNITGCNGTLQGAKFITGALNNNCSINVEFSRNSYDVSVITGPGGSATVDKATVLHGDSWTTVLQPEPGYDIDSVTGCGAGSLVENTYTSTAITASCQLNVQFSKRLVAVTGLVAIGAPLSGATVEASCANNPGFVEDGTTDAPGMFTGKVAEVDLPCALRAASSNPAIVLHGLTTQAGRANITPLTDMVLALASGELPSAWYETGSVDSVLPLLSDAQEQLLALFAFTGYDIPSGEFKPFDSSFAIADAWGQLLDQLGRGIEQTAALDYPTLIAALLAQENYKFPLPNGDQEETAEACFNPVLYEIGTRLVRKTHSIKTSGDTVNHNLLEHELENVSLAATEQGQVLTQKYNLATKFYLNDQADNASSWVGEGNLKILVDADGKSVADISAQYSQSPAFDAPPEQVLLDSTYTGTYDPQGNLIRFRFPSNTDSSETFNHVEELNFTLRFSPSELNITRTESTQTITRQFVGIKSLVRGGKTYDACEFKVSRKKTVLPGSTNPEFPAGEYTENYSQYFLVGAGVEVTDTSITSISINGLEVYSNNAQ